MIPPPNRPTAIRPKTAGSAGGDAVIRLTHEFFFAAGIGASTPARRVLSLLDESRRHLRDVAREETMIQEMPVAQALSACAMIADVDRCCISCIAASVQRRACACRARTSRASYHQHFLKREAVFFDVLVYSGCSASRFPSARSEV
jgi:hypothetical protein